MQLQLFRVTSSTYRLLFLFVLTCLMGRAAQARLYAPPDTEFASLSRPDFKILTPEECRADFQRVEWQRESAADIQQTITQPSSFLDKSTAMMNWTPSGASERPNRADCTAPVLEELMLTSGSSQARQASDMQNFFNRCGDHLARNAPSPVWALLKVSKSLYSTCDNPAIRKVLIHLDNRLTLRGLLALKPGNEKRPLIIVRCGVFCNAGDSSHRMMLMHLFDESAFNVLAINNITGSDYIIDNGFLSLGGFDEGTQMIRLAALIQQLPLSSRVSSLHALGVSLGGQGALFAAKLNQYNLDSRGLPLFSSVLAISPVVDLQSSMTNLFSSPVIGDLAKKIFFSQFAKSIQFLPALADLFPEMKQTRPAEIPIAVAAQAAQHYAEAGTSWYLDPFKNSVITSTKELWASNNFLKLATVSIKTPTLVFAAGDDQIVSTALNAAKLQLQTQAIAGDNLAVVTVPHGSHAAFNMIYGWQTTSTLYRTFFLSHSPELLKRMRQNLATFPPNRISYWSHLWRNTETHAAQSFKFTAGKATLRIHFVIFSRERNRPSCLDQDPVTADSFCYRQRDSEIPLAEIQGRTPWNHIPRNSTEAEAMSRWANQNLTVVNSAAQPITGTHSDGAGLMWKSYDSF
jgi:pimeloyl-ACP methyl ester carboxylesterase